MKQAQVDRMQAGGFVLLGVRLYQPELQDLIPQGGGKPKRKQIAQSAVTPIQPQSKPKQTQSLPTPKPVRESQNKSLSAVLTKLQKSRDLILQSSFFSSFMGNRQLVALVYAK